MAPNHRTFRKNSGFTLLELVLVVVLLATIAWAAIPMYQSLEAQNNIDLASDAFVRMARRAQTFSVSARNNSSWGIAASTSALTLFEGVTFASRVSSSDEIFVIPPGVYVTGTPEFTFSKLYGELAATSTETFSTANATVTISISKKGVPKF